MHQIQIKNKFAIIILQIIVDIIYFPLNDKHLWE